jgi:hypothetical protein
VLESEGSLWGSGGGTGSDGERADVRVESIEQLERMAREKEASRGQERGVAEAGKHCGGRCSGERV